MYIHTYANILHTYKHMFIEIQLIYIYNLKIHIQKVFHWLIVLGLSEVFQNFARSGTVGSWLTIYSQSNRYLSMPNHMTCSTRHIWVAKFLVHPSASC